MKKLHLQFIAVALCIKCLTLQAQTDVTDLIINPSFEDNVDDVADGWDYNEDALACAWHVINTDGDETKTGDNICGLWNATLGDPIISQTITDVDNGIYKLTADMMCSRNAESLRLTTQRIFINNNSILFGANADTNYSAVDLAILTDNLSETITFANYPSSPIGKENGPFMTCEVTTTVTDGTIVLGVKTNGSDSQYEFEFPHLTAGNGWGWFKVDNFTLTYMGAVGIEEINNETRLNVSVKNGYVTVDGVKEFKIYSLNGALIPSDEQLTPGIYLIRANHKVAKIIVTNK